MSVISAVKSHIESFLIPTIDELISPDKYIVVIGGSVSYGFADKLSDVDVLIIWDLPKEIWFPKLGQHLFRHQLVGEYKIQVVPLNLQDNQYAHLYGLLHGSTGILKDMDVKSLYETVHFIPIHDTENMVAAAKEYIDSLGLSFWKEKCMQHCCRHIDVLESFYSAVKRNDELTVIMFYGVALQGLLEIAYLTQAQPYPTAKWIWSGLQTVDKDFYMRVKEVTGSSLPKTCEEMRNGIYNTTKLLVDKMIQGAIIPQYIGDDLLNP